MVQNPPLIPAVDDFAHPLVTERDYHAAVRKMGLRPTDIPNVYRDANGDVHNVPDPANMPPAVRLGVIRRLKKSLGLDDPTDN